VEATIWSRPRYLSKAWHAVRHDVTAGGRISFSNDAGDGEVRLEGPGGIHTIAYSRLRNEAFWKKWTRSYETNK
jgi:hypothetical protein